MKLIEPPFETGQNNYYSFTITHEWKEFEWTLIEMRDSNSAYTERTISWCNDEPNVDEEKLMELLLNNK